MRGSFETESVAAFDRNWWQLWNGIRNFAHAGYFVTALHDQVEIVVQQHEQDLAAGYTGTFLPTALGDKYKNAAKELVWQWLFPAKMLTLVPSTNEYRRYHLHETHV